MAKDRYDTPQSVAAAVATGSLRDQLDAMRVRIATAIDSPEIRGADLAALSRRLHELTKEIAALDASEAEEEAENGVSEDEDWSNEPL